MLQSRSMHQRAATAARTWATYAAAMQHMHNGKCTRNSHNTTDTSTHERNIAYNCALALLLGSGTPSAGAAVRNSSCTPALEAEHAARQLPTANRAARWHCQPKVPRRKADGNSRDTPPDPVSRQPRPGRHLARCWQVASLGNHSEQRHADV